MGSGTMNAQQAVKERRRLITRMDKTSQALTDFCKPHRNSIGLIPDEIRKSSQYIELASAYYNAKHDMAVFMATPINKTAEHKRAFADETKRHYGRV